MEEYFVKHGVEQHEYDMHLFAYNLGAINVPEIICYDPKQKILTMKKISGDNLSNIYGEEPHNISFQLFEKVRFIVQTLLENNMEYIDITGYNFMLDNDENLWVIDFEHAKMKRPKINYFLKSFCEGENSWNPDFK
jgi:tRNA A-37 threonylcarbamoyl transferase component Bud32